MVTSARISGRTRLVISPDAGASADTAKSVVLGFQLADVTVRAPTRSNVKNHTGGSVIDQSLAPAAL
jgi:hypothetical protein